MDPGRLEGLRMSTVDAKTRAREEATKVATDFEQLFVRQLVSTMRSAASIGGDGGMFGSGPGADTYSDWFDQNLATQVSRGSRLGIAEAILGDMQRHGEIAPEPPSKPLAKGGQHGPR